MVASKLNEVFLKKGDLVCFKRNISTHLWRKKHSNIYYAVGEGLMIPKNQIGVVLEPNAFLSKSSRDRGVIFLVADYQVTIAIQSDLIYDCVSLVSLKENGG